MNRTLKCCIVGSVFLVLACGAAPDVEEPSEKPSEPEVTAQESPETVVAEEKTVRGTGTLTLPEGVFPFDAYECQTAPKEAALGGTMDFRFSGEGMTPAGRPFGIAAWQARRGEKLAQELVLGVQPREDEPQERAIPGTDQMMPLGPVRILTRKVVRNDDGSWKRVVGGGDEADAFLEASGNTITGRAHFSGAKADDPHGRSVDLGEGVLEVTCF